MTTELSEADSSIKMKKKDLELIVARLQTSVYHTFVIVAAQVPEVTTFCPRATGIRSLRNGNLLLLVKC